jgi:ABC-type polysaccharide/polyol phosphate transport system ATPase subunit
MSSDKDMVTFNDVWKKYSRHSALHRNFRDDISSFLSFGAKETSISKDEFFALHKISFEIHAGETIGLYGPNGSGKSTILKLIAGVTYPTKGSINVNGRVAPLLEVGAGFHPDLSGEENIFINGAILGMSIKEIRQKRSLIIDFSGVKDFIDIPVKKYSSGMYLRLAFSIAIHSDADIFLFDEIVAVGDEEFKKQCIKKIRSIQASGKTIIVVSHDKDLLHDLSNRIIVINQGTVG